MSSEKEDEWSKEGCNRPTVCAARCADAADQVALLGSSRESTKVRQEGGYLSRGLRSQQTHGCP